MEKNKQQWKKENLEISFFKEWKIRTKEKMKI